MRARPLDYIAIVVVVGRLDQQQPKGPAPSLAASNIHRSPKRPALACDPSRRGAGLQSIADLTPHVRDECCSQQVRPRAPFVTIALTGPRDNGAMTRHPERGVRDR